MAATGGGQLLPASSAPPVAKVNKSVSSSCLQPNRLGGRVLPPLPALGMQTELGKVQNLLSSKAQHSCIRN